MKKVPTIFERDWDGDRSRVVDVPHPDCVWVFAGEGTATRKLDGTCCMVSSNTLYKRREVKRGKPEPASFQHVSTDEKTGKRVGWVPVTDGSEDRWYREAWTGADNWPDGTYELIGPKVQGNPEYSEFHLLIKHGGGPAGPIDNVPRTFEGLREWMAGKDIEGIVFHHPDGRMGKIKLRDFGLKRDANATPPHP